MGGSTPPPPRQFELCSDIQLIRECIRARGAFLGLRLHFTIECETVGPIPDPWTTLELIFLLSAILGRGTLHTTRVDIPLFLLSVILGRGTLHNTRVDMPLQDNIYNWIANFLTNRDHRTNFDGVVSASAGINASIVQGTTTGPGSFDVNASDLHPRHPENHLNKYADDCYSDCSVCHLSPCSGGIRSRRRVG